MYKEIAEKVLKDKNQEEYRRLKAAGTLEPFLDSRLDLDGRDVLPGPGLPAAGRRSRKRSTRARTCGPRTSLSL